MAKGTVSNVYAPRIIEHILNPVSAHWTSTVVLSKSVKNKKIRYMLSNKFARVVKLIQSVEGKIPLRKQLNTP